MNSNAITKAAIVVVGILIGLLVMMKILTEGWNALANLYKYLLIVAIAIGLLAPKIGLGILAFGAFYIDTFKRLLVVAGNVTYLDIAYILSFSPFLVLAIFCSCLYHIIAVGTNQRPGAVKLAVFTIILMGVFSVFAITSYGFGLSGLQLVANGAAFIALIFIIPVQFGTREEIVKARKAIILFSIPVLLYGIAQWAFGFNDFEIAYLQTGLSTETRILSGQDFRIFSTLNSSQNFAKIMGMLAVMVLFTFKKSSLASFSWRIPLAGLFFFAAVISGSRTGLVMALIVLMSLMIFRWKSVTILFYAATTSLLLFIIINAESLYERNALKDWEAGLSDIAAESQLIDYRNIQIVTLNARLRSLSLLSKAEYWTPFGAGLAKEKDLLTKVKIHDIITSFLVRMGYVPCAAGLVLMIYALSKIHKGLWKMDSKSLDFRIVLFSLSFAISVLIGGMSATANLYTFPVNYFFYLFIGFGVAIAMIRRREVLDAKKAVQEESPASQPGLGKGARGMGPPRLSVS